DFLDVRGERDRRRGTDRHADAIGMDGTLRSLELADSCRVQAARHEYPNMAVAGLVEPGADLLDEIDCHPATFTRRVQAHAAQPPTTAEYSMVGAISGWTWRAPKLMTRLPPAASTISCAAVAHPEQLDNMPRRAVSYTPKRE